MDVVTKGIGAAVPLIERRLELQAPLSEDNFRYLAFHGLFKAGVDVARVALEYPHPADSRTREKVDTVLLDAKGEPETAIEFKYHRSNISGRNLPRTMSAGQLIADFARLRDFPNVHRFVVYLTDGEMFGYFRNNNRLSRLFSRSEQEISADTLPSAKIFRENADDWSAPVRTQVVGQWDVGSDHKLVVWRVWRVESSRQDERQARRQESDTRQRTRVSRNITNRQGNDTGAVAEGIGAAVPLIRQQLGLPEPLSEGEFRDLVLRGLLISSGGDVRMPLGYRHPANSREQIDAVILDATGAPETAIEFKYHRSNPGGGNLPRTQFAGELLAEFAKLRDIPDVQRFVMYLTDGEMFRYFNNPDNGLNRLFSTAEQEISDGNIPRTRTLRRFAGDWRSPVRARMMGSWDVGNGHRLVVWRVMA